MDAFAAHLYSHCWAPLSLFLSFSSFSSLSLKFLVFGFLDFPVWFKFPSSREGYIYEQENCSILDSSIKKWSKEREKRMDFSSVSKWVLVCCMLTVLGAQLIHCTVTYDRKTIVINGQRRILISGSIHYPRSTPEVYLNLSTFCYFLHFLERKMKKALIFIYLFFLCVLNSCRCGRIW